jgi:hypothetical protein
MRLTRVIAVSATTGALALTGSSSALAWGGGERHDFRHSHFRDFGFRHHREFRDDFRFRRDDFGRFRHHREFRDDFKRDDCFRFRHHRDWGWDGGDDEE